MGGAKTGRAVSCRSPPSPGTTTAHRDARRACAALLPLLTRAAGAVWAVIFRSFLDAFVSTTAVLGIFLNHSPGYTYNTGATGLGGFLLRATLTPHPNHPSTHNCYEYIHTAVTLQQCAYCSCALTAHVYGQNNASKALLTQHCCTCSATHFSGQTTNKIAQRARQKQKTLQSKT